MSPIAQPPIRRTSSRRGPKIDASLFTALQREVAEAGLMRRRYGYYWLKLIGMPIVTAAAVLAFIAIGDSWWQMVSAVGFAVIFTQIAFLGHDAAHRQIFKSGRWNDWTSMVIANLFVGISYGWWQRKHSKHHANPNKIGADDDIDLPAIAFTPDQAAAKRERGPVSKWLVERQGWAFFPLLTLEGLSLHWDGLKRVFGPAPVNRRAAEIAMLAVRLGGFVTLVFLVLSPGVGFAFLGVQLAVFGIYMGASFAPNHKGMPLVAADARLDFLSRQVLTSRNIRGGRFTDVALGGLNYQIEHHLFPSMPRQHLRKAAVIVSRYCSDHSVPYTQTGLFTSYGIVIRYLNRVGLGQRDPFACPLVEMRAALG